VKWLLIIASTSSVPGPSPDTATFQSFATRSACEEVRVHVRNLLSWAHIECFKVDDRVMEDLR
jgi:hypothetical protein